MAPEAPKVEPTYWCHGQTPKESYDLPLTVEVKGENYFLRWADGIMVGLGLRKGDWLSVAFVNTANGSVGTVLYEIKPGQLVGTWTGGDGDVYPESCLAGGKPSRAD